MVWLMSALGPDRAARAIADSPLLDTPDHRMDVVDQLHALVDDQFGATEAIGPGAYSTFFNRPDDPRLRRDAAGVIAELGRYLRRLDVLP